MKDSCILFIFCCRKATTYNQAFLQITFNRTKFFFLYRNRRWRKIDKKMKLNKIKTFQEEYVQVVIETPKGSSHKYDYDCRMEVFCLKKIMPLGMTFPFDFGFIPGTRGEDGDPLDILLLMDKPNIQGVVVQCRVIGLLEAVQIEKDGKQVRNDRILAVSDLSKRDGKILDVTDLSAGTKTEIESFFRQYNTLAGKEFKSLGWKGADEAMEVIRSQMD
jgi:inorganic pyrophosphatase